MSRKARRSSACLANMAFFISWSMVSMSDMF
jgi:hypothetical protein